MPMAPHASSPAQTCSGKVLRRAFVFRTPASARVLQSTPCIQVPQPAPIAPTSAPRLAYIWTGTRRTCLTPEKRNDSLVLDDTCSSCRTHANAVGVLANRTFRGAGGDSTRANLCRSSAWGKAISCGYRLFWYTITHRIRGRGVPAACRSCSRRSATAALACPTHLDVTCQLQHGTKCCNTVRHRRARWTWISHASWHDHAQMQACA